MFTESQNSGATTRSIIPSCASATLRSLAAAAFATTLELIVQLSPTGSYAALL